jgi:site-specific DNA-methyltransferase (adenine-specific)
MYGTGFPKSLNVGKAIDDAAGAERKVVGSNPTWREAKRDNRIMQPVRGEGAKHITAPATPEAARWEGFGTALKPAHEPIVLARKPLSGTVAANVQAFGTGALNIDGCRIETSEELQGSTVRSDIRGGGFAAGHRPGLDIPAFKQNPSGRWPANVLLDEEAAAFLDEMSGERPSGAWDGKRNTPKTKNVFGEFEGGNEKPRAGDSGGASRFFYTAKAPREERDAGLELLEASTGGEATGRKDGSAGLSSPRAGAGRTGGARNTHPTVKPIDLMRWLVRLVTPPGGVVLDPFAGSASTGVACLHEGLRFVGIERDVEYFRMAKERLSAWAEVKASLTTIKARAEGQMPLFAKASP